jgi:ABC-2 type transport system ATP-binding protein
MPLSTPPGAASPPALEIEGVTKTYPGGLTALHGLDLRVASGEFFGLLGANGAGKTTTIGIVTSLCRKSGGRVRVFGHDLDREPGAVRRLIGLCPQEINFNLFETVEDILLNQAGFYGVPRAVARPRVARVLEQLDLGAKRRTVARALSGGMKRRLLIARALVHEPRLVILDEPTAGVDVEMRRDTWAFLRRLNEEGRTIILTTHYLEEAEHLCDRIAILDHGRLLTVGPRRELLARLTEEAYVLDLADGGARDRLPAPPPGVRWRALDAHTLEAFVAQDGDLTTLFTRLDAAGLRVRSLRNRANRLEELFLHLTSRSEEASAP